MLSIATWITPCNSRSVKDAGTSTRRHIIGLIPVSHTLICRIASASAAGRSVFSLGDCLSRRVIPTDYHRSPRPSPRTPEILMLPTGCRCPGMSGYSSSALQ